MQRWEYKAFTPKRQTDNVDEFNRLGEEGWELVGITVNSVMGTFYALFKRPKTD